MDFKPTKRESPLQAIGSIEKLPRALQLALDPGTDFEPMPVPKTGDWLAEHHEPGQTFDQFLRSNPKRPNARRSRIYLQPLGEFPQIQSPSLDTLKAYAAACFNMDAKVLSPLDIGGEGITTRLNPYSGNRQILTTDVLDILKKRLPEDAFCILGITMVDLYPHPSWNFVFGQASFRSRVGVFSFARYDPMFYGQVRGKNYQKVLLMRSCKVLVHETAHMLLLEHCIFFKCVMNGSNHLEESDARPLALCPVCLRKLHFIIGFDVLKRYNNLLQFYRDVDFDREAEWTAKRLKRIMGVLKPPQEDKK